MSAILEQVSNSTSLSLAVETAPGVVDGAAVWVQQEPNSYKDFGGQYKLVARNPINSGRQNKKGVITDLDVSGGWQEDITFVGIAGKIEGLMYAAFRTKATYNHTFASGDVVFDVDTKTLSTTAFDMTALSLIPGEWIFCDDDIAGDRLGANLGFARVFSVAAHALVFDKLAPSDPFQPITDAAGTGKTVKLYFGKVVKNEIGNTIKKTTYAAERTLGKDDTNAAGPQAEYLNGCIINEGQFVFNTADKGTCDWTLMGMKYETRTSTAGIKAGTRPSLVEGSAFNTSTDIKRMELGLVGTDVPLYAYVMDLTITVKNNAKANKAIGVLGAISNTEGQFAVTASCNAYFSNVTAAQAIENNSDVTLDVVMVKDNQGIVFDLPLVSLGDGRPKITQNEVITLPLDIDAATAAAVNPNMNHTLCITLFDVLPDAAM